MAILVSVHWGSVGFGQLTWSPAQENGDGRCASSWVCATTLGENSYRQDGGAGLCLR
jgi:hypothetical protein